MRGRVRSEGFTFVLLVLSLGVVKVCTLNLSIVVNPLGKSICIWISTYGELIVRGTHSRFFLGVTNRTLTARKDPSEVRQTLWELKIRKLKRCHF